MILTTDPIHRTTSARRPSLETRDHAGDAAMSPHPSYLVSVETLRSHWQTALDAAEDALRAAGFVPAGRGASPPGDRRSWPSADPTEHLLQGLARDRHQDAEFMRLLPRTDARLLLGLPPVVAACVFNLDGVLIGSAEVHAAAWSETFDEFITRRIEETGGRFAPFNTREDYRRHMHGKPRLEGVRAFLASRGVSLPEGSPDDPPGTETVHGLANRKNQVLRRRLEQYGVRAFAGATRYLEIARDAHVPYAIVSASANTGTILERAGLADLITHSIDGNTALEQGLRPRPAPDMFLAACRMLGTEPRRTAVFETVACRRRGSTRSRLRLRRRRRRRRPVGRTPQPGRRPGDHRPEPSSSTEAHVDRRRSRATRRLWPATAAISACLFDLDGVLTQTHALHSAAWTQVFDAYLAARARPAHEPFVPFDPVADYGAYVDGKQRRDGVRSFLASRHIDLPEGALDDPPDAETVAGLGNQQERGRPRAARAAGRRRRTPARFAIWRRSATPASARSRLVEHELPRAAAGSRTRPSGRRPRRRRRRGANATFAESRPRTRSSPPRRCWACGRKARRCSRIHWPESRRVAQAGSGWWSGSTGSATPSSFVRTAPTSSSPTSRSFFPLSSQTPFSM